MLTTYPAVFYKAEDGYSVSFPDLPGALTCGKTLEEATEMAIDCMAGYIFTSKLDNEFIPEPTPVDNINLLDYVDLEDGELLENASVVMIAVDVEAYAKKNFNKSVRKNLTIPVWLANFADEEGINYSKVLQDALTDLYFKQL